MRLQAGAKYRIIGFCDEECEDLDLALFDSSGDLVDEDALPDDFPVLEVIGPRDDAFLLEASMVTCTVEPCEYGVLVVGRRGSGEEGGGVVSEVTHIGELEAADSRRTDGEYEVSITVREGGQ